MEIRSSIPDAIQFQPKCLIPRRNLKPIPSVGPTSVRQRQVRALYPS